MVLNCSYIRFLFIILFIVFHSNVFSVPFLQNKKLEAQIKSYKKQDTLISATFSKNYSLVKHIRDKLIERKLPSTFIFVPYIESSFNKKAVSHAKAAGLWQLMPKTAKRFGLIAYGVNDERFNPLKSTDAAIDYLDFLYKLFNKDEYLTLAAYNAGEGRVLNALKKYSNHQTIEDLHLPKETRDYVYRYRALTAIYKANKASKVVKNILLQPLTRENKNPIFVDLSTQPSMMVDLSNKKIIDTKVRPIAATLTP